MTARSRLRALRLPLILAPTLAPGLAQAQGLSQGMVLTQPRAVALPARTVPLPPPRPGETREAAPIAPAGRLPNQTTGSHRERAVHDICIGC